MQTDLARQYLEYARIHPPGRLALQHHVFKLIFQWSKDDVVIRDRMIRRGNEVDDYLEVLDMVEARYPVSEVALAMETPVPSFVCANAFNSVVRVVPHSPAQESVEASRRMGCNELALPDVPLAPRCVL